MPDDPNLTVEPSAAPSAEQAADLLPDDGEQPLIPRGAEPQPEPEKQPPQRGEQQAKPEAAKPRESGPKEPQAPAKPPPGYRAETDFRELQSAYDRREAQLRQELDLIRNSQAAESQVEGARREIRAWLQAQGIDPDQQAGQVDNIARTYRRAVEAEQKSRSLESRVNELQSLAVNTVMASWVDRLSVDHKLDPQDVDTLRALYNPDALTDADAIRRIGAQLGERAKQLGEIRAAANAARRAKQEEVRPQQFEGARGSAAMTDEQIVQAYADGRMNDHKQAEAAMQRLGIW